MFRFLKINRPDTCPVQEEMRIWLEGAFLQLLGFFGKENTIQRKVLIKHYSDFPIQYPIELLDRLICTCDQYIIDY